MATFLRSLASGFRSSYKEPSTDQRGPDPASASARPPAADSPTPAPGASEDVESKRLDTRRAVVNPPSPGTAWRQRRPSPMVLKGLDASELHGAESGVGAAAASSFPTVPRTDPSDSVPSSSPSPSPSSSSSSSSSSTSSPSPLPPTPTASSSVLGRAGAMLLLAPARVEANGGANTTPSASSTPPHSGAAGPRISPAVMRSPLADGAMAVFDHFPDDAMRAEADAGGDPGDGSGGHSGSLVLTTGISARHGHHHHHGGSSGTGGGSGSGGRHLPRTSSGSGSPLAAGGPAGGFGAMFGGSTEGLLDADATSYRTGSLSRSIDVAGPDSASASASTVSSAGAVSRSSPLRDSLSAVADVPRSPRGAASAGSAGGAGTPLSPSNGGPKFAVGGGAAGTATALGNPVSSAGSPNVLFVPRRSPSGAASSAAASSSPSSSSSSLSSSSSSSSSSPGPLFSSPATSTAAAVLALVPPSAAWLTMDSAALTLSDTSATSRATEAVARSLREKLPPRPWDGDPEGVPDTISKEFQRPGVEAGLAVTDAGFRKIVKKACLFPAYFGLVLHQRTIEWASRDVRDFANGIRDGAVVFLAAFLEAGRALSPSDAAILAKHLASEAVGSGGSGGGGAGGRRPGDATPKMGSGSGSGSGSGAGTPSGAAGGVGVAGRRVGPGGAATLSTATTPSTASATPSSSGARSRATSNPRGGGRISYSRSGTTEEAGTTAVLTAAADALASVDPANTGPAAVIASALNLPASLLDQAMAAARRLAMSVGGAWWRRALRLRRGGPELSALYATDLAAAELAAGEPSSAATTGTGGASAAAGGAAGTSSSSSSSSSTAAAAAELITMDEFLRAWTPLLHRGDKIERFLALVTPPLPPQHPRAASMLRKKRSGLTGASGAAGAAGAAGGGGAKPGKGGKGGSALSPIPFDGTIPVRGPSPPHWCRTLEMEEPVGLAPWDRKGADPRLGTVASLRHLRFNRVFMDDMRPLVEALVDRHPDLKEFKDDPVRRSRYVTCVLVSIFSSLHGQCSNDISRAEVRESNLVEAFYLCATCATSNVLPFSREYFDGLHAAFLKADIRRRGVVEQAELEANFAVAVCTNALERVFAGRARPLASGVEGYLNFEDFLWLVLAQNDRMTETSTEYWFRVLDLDDDNILSLLDLECSYENRVWQMRERGDKVQPTTSDTMTQLFDLVRPMQQGRITCLDIKRSGSGKIVFDLLLNVSTTGAAAKSYLV